MSGIWAPAISATLGAQTPHAITTYSASIVPRVVLTLRTRPPVVSKPVTSVFAMTWSAPISSAFSRHSVPNRRESQTPTSGT